MEDKVKPKGTFDLKKKLLGKFTRGIQNYFFELAKRPKIDLHTIKG
jgi:hypothetical protein